MANKNDSTILEMKHITKRFGHLVAVNDVSISLQRGKLITFLGPSGCGKTTLLRTISGFTEPDEGEIVLDGQVITGIPPNNRDTAMVFQNYALFPHMTVAQNIGFGLQIRKRPKQEIDAEVERLLDLVQMEGLGNRKPHELSGGQQQRVALARALSLHPKILLLDEPLSNLDANLRVSMREEVRKLQRRLDLTIIFVTHDQEEAMSISDLLVVMDHGVVKQIGPPTEVYENPVDDFVANFIGHVNFFPGEVADLSWGEMTFNISQGSLKLDKPKFPVSVGDKLRAVVRPESIDIVAAEKEVADAENVVEGRVEGAMYIGSVMRFTIAAGDQTICVDETDPQYRGMFQENQRVKLILKKRIHMLKSEEHD
jgi:ABC-type Fe3+/spermidine/putrescine transport system ATPase subunit